MKCLFCGKGPAEGVTIYRINAKGQKGKWACEKHIGRTDATIAPEVRDVVRVLEGRAPGGDR